MSLSVTSSLTGGTRRVVNKNGLLLALTFLITGVGWQVMFYSAIDDVIPQSEMETGTQAATIPTLDIPIAVSIAGTIGLLFALQYVTIIAIRTFVSGYSDGIPSEVYTRNIGFVFANAIVGGLLFGIAVFIGSMLLVVPGVIAYVAFIFVFVYITAEDDNFIAAFSNSWSLTRGHWLKLFGILVIGTIALSIVQFVTTGLVTVVALFAGSPELVTLASGAVSLPFTVVLLGIIAEAYNQLQADRTDTTPDNVAIEN